MSLRKDHANDPVATTVDEEGRTWITAEGRTKIIETDGSITEIRRDGYMSHHRNPALTIGPAGPGNKRAVVSGAFSKQILSTRSADVCDALIGSYPWLIETDVVGIEQYCRAEARARLLGDHIWKVVEEQGIDAVKEYYWREVSTAEKNAMHAAAALGLTPEGRLKIAKDAGFAQHFNAERLGTLMEDGRALREAQGRK